jgi:hypothetical protein
MSNAASLVDHLGGGCEAPAWRSLPIDVHDGVRERLRRLLRQVVPDAARDHPVRVLADELAGVRARVRMRSPVGISLERDRRYLDRGARRQPPLELVVRRLALGQPSRQR